MKVLRTGQTPAWVASSGCNTVFVSKRWRGSRTVVLAQLFHNRNGRALINCSSLTSQCKNYMQSEKQEKTFTEMLWIKLLWGNLLLPEDIHTLENKVLRNIYQNYFMFWAALLNRNLDWTSINAYSIKLQLGSTSSSISSLTFLNFRLHISVITVVSQRAKVKLRKWPWKT